MILTKFIKKVASLPFEFQWFRAYSGFGKISPQVQLERLTKLHAKDGPKQIVLMQIANALSALQRKSDAISKYSEALQAEKSWGGRKNRSVSDYIQLYGQYRILILKHGYSHEPDQELLDMYQRLKSSRVPSSLKDYHLPLPQAPNGQAY